MSTLVALLSALSGVFFSCIGICVRIGTGRRLHELHVTGIMAGIGALFFSLRASHTLVVVPGDVLAISLVAGVTQYVTMYVVRLALRLGPLTPMWCAVMLGFVPVVIYSAVAFGERLTPWHWAAVTAAVGCVLFASTLSGEKGDRPPPGPRTARSLTYGLTLLGVFALNCVLSVAVKHLAMQPDGQGGNLMLRYGDAFRAWVYLTIFLCIAADQAVFRRRVEQPAAVLLTLGTLAAGGSIGGLWLLSICASAPAASVFVINAMASIVFTSAVGTLLFRERRSWRWYTTVCLGLLAALLSQAPAIARSVGVR